MMKARPICSPKGHHEISNKFILGLLWQRYPEQLEAVGWRPLPGIVGKPKVTGEAQIVILHGELIKPAIVQSLHPQSMDRIRLVTFQP